MTPLNPTIETKVDILHKRPIHKKKRPDEKTKINTKVIVDYLIGNKVIGSFTNETEEILPISTRNIVSIVVLNTAKSEMFQDQRNFGP